MAFDPDAYLAGKTTVSDPPATGFDPDAYLKSKTAPASGFDPDAYLGTKYDALAKDESFDPVAHYAQNPEDLATSREVFKRRAAEPMDWGKAAGKFASGALPALGSGIASLARGAVGFGSNFLSGRLGLYGTPEEQERARLENMASLQLGAEKGFRDLPTGLARNVARLFGKTDRTLSDQEIDERIQHDAAQKQVENEISQGNLAGPAAENYAQPETLAAQGTPVRPETVEAGSFIGDPTSYVIPGLVEAAGPAIGKAITSPVLQTAGKAISGAGQLASKALGGHGLLYGGMYGLFSHNPLAAVGGFAAEVAARNVAPYLGRTLQEAGAEAAGTLPPGVQNVATKALKAGAQGAVTGAAISAPFAAAAQSPEEAGSALGGGLGIGGALGAAGGVAHGRAIDVAGKFNQLAQEGAAIKYGYGLDDQHAVGMAQLTPQDQMAVNAYRARFNGMTGPDGRPIQIYALSTPDYLAQIQKAGGGNASGTRGFISGDGTQVFVNAGMPEPQIGLAHEAGGHATEFLGQVAKEHDVATMQDTLRKALYNPGGTPSPMLQQFTQNYRDALAQGGASKEMLSAIGKLDPTYFEKEFIAQHAVKILNGENIANFHLPKPLTERLTQGAAQWMRDQGILPKTGGDIGWGGNEIKAVTDQLRDALYNQGKKSEDLRAQRAAGNEPEPTVSARIAQLEAQTSTPPTGATPLSERNAYRAAVRELAGLREDIGNKTTPAQSPRPVPPSTPNVPQGTIPSRIAVAKALEQQGISKQEAAQWASVAKGNTVDEMVVDAIKQRGAKKFPSQTPNVPAPIAQKTPTTEINLGTAKTGVPLSVNVHHGTAVPEFSQFQDEHLGANTDANEYRRSTTARLAHSFTDDPDTAQYYANMSGRLGEGRNPRIITAKVNLENPLVIDREASKSDWPSGYYGLRDAEILKQAKAQGHDGVVIKNDVDGWRIKTPEELEAQKSYAPQFQGSTLSLKSNIIKVFDPKNIEIPKESNVPAPVATQGSSLSEGATQPTSGAVVSPEEVAETPVPKAAEVPSGPIEAFHSTSAPEFTSFDTNKIGESVGHKDPVSGFYFSNNPNQSSHIPEGREGSFRTMRVKLNLKNPFVGSDYASLDKFGTDGESVRAELERQGYDGVILANGEEIIAFHPEQIEISQQDISKTTPKVKTQRTPEEAARIASEAELKAIASAPLSPDYPTLKPVKKSKFSEEQRKAKVDQQQKEFTTQFVHDAKLNALLDAIGDDLTGLHRVTDQFGNTSIVGEFDPSDPLHTELVKVGGNSKLVQQRAQDIQAKKGTPQYILYRSAEKPGISGSGGEGSVPDFGMEQRKKEYEAQPSQERAAGQHEGTTQQKVVIPLGTSLSTKSGKLQVSVFTMNELLSNAESTFTFMREKGLDNPYGRTYAEQEPQLVSDAQAYAENHAHGFTGDGTGPMKQFPDSGLPKPDPAYTPKPIPKDRFDVLNMLFANEKAGKLGEVTQAIQAKRDAGKQPTPRDLKQRADAEEAYNLAQENDRWVDHTSGETNALRAQLKGLGFDTADALKNPIETLEPQNILKQSDTPIEGTYHNARPHGFSVDPAQLAKEGLPRSKAVAGNFSPAEPYDPRSESTPIHSSDRPAYQDRYEQLIEKDDLTPSESAEYRALDARMKAEHGGYDKLLESQAKNDPETQKLRDYMKGIGRFSPGTNYTYGSKAAARLKAGKPVPLILQRRERDGEIAER